MIKELEEDREETQDPEVEFAIAGAVREYGGLEIILSMIQVHSFSHFAWYKLSILAFYQFLCFISLFLTLNPSGINNVLCVY